MRSFLPVCFLVVLLLALVLSSTLMGAQTYKVVHAFGAGTDGGGLWSSVVFDGKGNLYGTTSGGGAYGGGTVFELTPQVSGEWTEAILHSFSSSQSTTTGTAPFGGIVFDPQGNLYGTTETGGGPFTYGLAYRLSPGANGWTETVLRRFYGNPVGSPQWAMLIDSQGNLYGGSSGAFELSPTAGGWKETILHTFNARTGDGSGASLLVRDTGGNLYGTTPNGGTSTVCADGCGTVFEIQHLADGTWKESVIHDFPASSADGTYPSFGDKLAIDRAGNLYGTDLGGQGNFGEIFRLHPVGDGTWSETILHAIKYAQNGSGPTSGVVMDAAGNLYGTTIAGGDASCGCGVVYKLVHSNGQWVYIVLHRFIGSDGAQPDANLTLDGKGNIFGTTATGGAGCAGVVFEITP